MTTPISVYDVARALRGRFPGGLPSKKLQKLLYYCQGWHLAWVGRPLFHEAIEAWRMGPVVPPLWQKETHRPDEPEPPPLELSAQQRSIVDYVVGRYGSSSGSQLEHLTHGEAPWRDARPNEVIPHEALRSFFREDEQFRARQEQVASLRARADVYGLGPRPVDAAALAAVDRARRGGSVVDR